MKLKKIIKRAILIISLLLFIFWSILQYRDYQSYKNSIPANADMIIKINVDEILKSIAWNAIKNPSYYLSKSKKKETGKKLKKGFLIPTNFFVFNLKNDTKTLYTILKLKDSADFRKFIQKKITIKKIETVDNYTLLNDNSKRIHIIYNKSYAIISFKLNNNNTIANSVKLLTDFTPIKDITVLNNIKKSSNHISVYKNSDHIDINFKDGEIDIISEIKNNFIEISKTININNKSKDSYFFFSMQAKPVKKNISNLSINEINIPIDSILKNYYGSMSINLSDYTKQTDTIITYNYDENFEKIETKSIRDKKVPKIDILITGKNKKLKKILEQHKIIINNSLNTNLFPLYHLNFKTIDSTICEFTNYQSKNIHLNSSNSINQFAELNIDFNKLMNYNFLKIEELNKLNILNIKAYNKECITIEGNITLKNKNLNSFYYLLEK